MTSRGVERRRRLWDFSQRREDLPRAAEEEEEEFSAGGEGRSSRLRVVCLLSALGVRRVEEVR